MDAIERTKPTTKPTTQQRGRAKVLRAKPVEGKVDYVELTRDTIKKFPKILAVLAN